MKTQRLTMAALLIAIGTLTGHLISIPIGAARCFPVQSTINILSAVLLGPGYAVSNAFCISALRNFMGTGSPLAFPGSMIGALLAGLLYQKFKNNLAAAGGEIFGTSILGALVAYPIAAFLLGKEAALFFYVIPFLISSVGGSIIGYLLVKILEKSTPFQKLKLEK